MSLALSLFFTLLVCITRFAYGRWSSVPGVLWATWWVSATLLFFLPDSLDLLSLDSILAIVLPHCALMGGLLPNCLLSAPCANRSLIRSGTQPQILAQGANRVLIWWLFTIFLSAALIGSVLQIFTTGAGGIAELAEIYEVRDSLVGKSLVIQKVKVLKKDNRGDHRTQGKCDSRRQKNRAYEAHTEISYPDKNNMSKSILKA